MFCQNCGSNNPDGVAYCTSCGAPMDAQQIQQAPQQPVQQNYNPAAQTQDPAKGLSIASMVLGIVSLFIFAYIAGTLAIIFACVAKRKGSTNKMATAGLVLGIIGVASWLLMQIACNACGYALL